MANITLVGERWAVEGAEFTYYGPSSECRDCKVRTVCFNLKGGRRYRIKSIRDTKHKCSVHDQGVVAVEIEELSLRVALERVKVLEGAVVTYPGNICEVKSCPHKRVCQQVLVQKDQKIKIIAVGEELECVDGKKMVAVEIEEVN